MTEVTRVPLRPIAKGSLTKLWLGVLAAIAIAGGLAWASMPSFVTVDEVRAGSGPNPAETDVVLVNYTGKLADGTEFDSGQATPLPLTNMIPGFREGAVQMQRGGRYEVRIPADKGYGAEERSNPQTGEVVIPANSDLIFEVELLEFMSNEDYQMRMQMMQQMMQQQGAPGAPAGAPAPPMPAPPR